MPSDSEAETRLPIPTQFVSNGEFWPVPRTRRQHRVEQLVTEMADERARALGLSRRRFLRTQMGMAVALTGIHTVYGCSSDGQASGPSTTATGFGVGEEATRDPDAACAVFAADPFILDAQTHHVDFDGPGDPAIVESIYERFTGCPPTELDPGGPCPPGSPQEKLSRTNYLREVFIDSETAVAMMSGLPSPTVEAQPISNDGMAETCRLVNDLGSSQRCLTQGMVTPNFPDTTDTGALGTLVRDMEHLVEDLGISAIKCYPGAGGNRFYPAPAWFLDDEAVAYPMYEEAVRLGIGVINVHKGFAQGVFSPEHCHPRDLPRAVADWPELDFVVFHSAVDVTPATDTFDELIRLRTDEMPEADNVYAELGGAWASMVLRGDDAAGHFLGKLLSAFGEDRVVWGTDSIWFGSPQWQINALKAFTMPPRLIDDFGYPEVTDEVKAKIFGRNAAALYGVDIDEVRCALPADHIEQTRLEVEGRGLSEASFRTYGPRSRREFLGLLRREGLA